MNSKLSKKIAALESKLDHYETFFQRLDSLLKDIGFEKGIKTLKESAYELLTEQELPSEIKGI